MMKDLLKNKKAVTGIAVGLVAIAVIIAVIAAVRSDKAPEETTETTAAQTEETVVTPEISVSSDETSPTAEAVTDKDTITPNERIELTTQTGKITQSGSDSVKPATQVTAQTGDNSGGIVIIGDDDVNVYSCGVAGHNCDSAETHSFVVSLEKKGCPICGSHSCKSFYAVDEWGNSCYDITLCPQYSEKKDPNIYCQDCGKKIGDGDNGTCVRFTVDTVCPICGKTVKAKTCHTHK